MAIITARFIMRPRADRYCVCCHEKIGMNPQIRIFGYACRGDRPYWISYCIPCLDEFFDGCDGHEEPLWSCYLEAKRKLAA